MSDPQVRDRIRFLRRGREVELDRFDPGQTLLDYLRLEEQACGTKEGCNEGDCGACTVVLARVENGRIRHRPVNSCILLAAQADGAEIITIEDIGRPGALHPVQAAMVEHHGAQCGFCTPGIVMSLFALYQESPRPVGRQTVTNALAGNLCRCTGYRPIVDAALAACDGPAADGFVGTAEARRSALAALDDDADLFVGNSDGFFAAPRSIESLRSLCAIHPDATLVAGATDVGLWITKKLQRLPKVIWLGRVDELKAIVETPDGLRIGAAVTHADAQARLAGLDPDLGELMRRFGSEQVRASGTIGGNIANGSPIGDLAPAFIALGARVVLMSREGVRSVPLDEFFVAYGRQDRNPGEFVRELVLEKPKPGRHLRLFKLSKRFEEDISAVMAAFNIALEADRVVDARIAFGGMAATPKRAAATERALIDARVSQPESWRPALDALARDFQPIGDARASAAYRARAARGLLERALTELSGRDTRLTRLVGAREGAGHV